MSSNDITRPFPTFQSESELRCPSCRGNRLRRVRLLDYAEDHEPLLIIHFRCAGCRVESQLTIDFLEASVLLRWFQADWAPG
jgi:hypothetical protein